MTSGGSSSARIFSSDLQAVDSGQPDIEQDYVEAGFAKQIETVFAARADAGFVAFVLENALQGFADAGFVVDDEDVSHCLALALGANSQLKSQRFP